MIKTNAFTQTGDLTAEISLNGGTGLRWIPDREGINTNAVFIGDRVILEVTWGNLLSTSDEDGLVRIVLDGTTLNSYYAAHDSSTGKWHLEVDLTYLLKPYIEDTNPHQGDFTGMYDYTDHTLTLYTENTSSVSASTTILILDGHYMRDMVHPLPTEMMSALPTDLGYPWASNNILTDTVMPPNKILWPMGNTGVIWLGIEGAHNWHYFGANGTPSADSIGEWDNCQSNGNGGVGYPGIVNLYGIAFHGKDEWYRIWFDKRDMYSCTEYAVVRWKSCTGNWRTAMFEATNYTTNLDGTTETNPLYDNYVELHGNTYQFDIHLDGLTRYGLWYYQDILSSPEIYAEIWPNSELINNSASRPKRLRCSVVNPKKYVVPNGDATKFYDFDCTLRYKKDSF